MSTRFFTNEGENTLLRKFAGVFRHNPDIRWFDALVGFFRSSGYFAIRPFLENVPEIRVLVGISVDQLVAESHANGLLFQGDPARAVREVMAGLREDVKGARYARDVEQGILQFVADVASGKLAIRAHPSKALHAKIYILRPDPFNEHHAGCVITGSSNLTDAGLGVGEHANVVVNYDTPWNSTRLMQRIGWVSRIGSTAPMVYNYVLQAGVYSSRRWRMQSAISTDCRPEAMSPCGRRPARRSSKKLAFSP